MRLASHAARRKIADATDLFHVVSATRIKGILQWIVLWYIRLLLFHGILSWLSACVVFDWWITLGVRSHLKLLASLSIPVLSFVACKVERTSKTCPSIVLGLYNKSTLLELLLYI